MYVYAYTPCKWCALIRSNSYPSHPCSQGKPGTCIAAPPEHQNGHCMPVHVHKTRQEPTLNSRACMRPRPFPVPVLIFAYCKQSKTGAGEGLRTRLHTYVSACARAHGVCNNNSI